MRTPLRCAPILLSILLPCVQGVLPARADEPAPTATTAQAAYEFRETHDPDGIGKFFLGREIAHVMGHQGADWLERPERATEERPDLLIQALDLRPGDVVADIGAGSGFFTSRLATEVGDRGMVLAVDIQPEMLDLLRRNMAKQQITNAQPVLGTAQDPRLPAGTIDLVLMVDVYHEFAYPREMMEAICRALKPGGRVVFVEYRAEDPKVPIKRVHKMSEAQVRREMQGLPLDWVRTDPRLPRQHVLIFRKRIPAP